MTKQIFIVLYFVKICYNYPYKRKGGIKMPSTGEKPGAGTYICDNCGQVVVLDDNTDTMPPCPRCDGTEFH